MMMESGCLQWLCDWRTCDNITYSFIANCQTAVVHKNKTKRRSKIYKSQYILRYNILRVKLQSVIRANRNAVRYLSIVRSVSKTVILCSRCKSVRRIWFGQVKILLNSFSSEKCKGRGSRLDLENRNPCECSDE